MLEGLTSEQYSEILAVAAVEQDPSTRADLRSAMQSLVTARAAGVKGVKLADFILDFGPKAPEEDQDPAEMDRQMMKLAGIFAAAEQAKEAQRQPTPAPIQLPKVERKGAGPERDRGVLS